LFIAFFKAWNEERRAKEKAVSASLARSSKPIANIKVNAETIEVTNDGEGAYFSVPIDIQGMVLGEKNGIFAKWQHSNSARSWIAKGQTCRLVTAKMKWTEGAMTWIIPTITADGVLSEVRSLYSSCPHSEPIARADDIMVSGSVIAEPDLNNGIQRFHVVLRAFDAISVVDK